MNSCEYERRQAPRVAVHNGMVTLADDHRCIADTKLLDISLNGLAFSTCDPMILSRRFLRFNLLIVDWERRGHLFLFQVKAMMVAITEAIIHPDPQKGWSRRCGITFVSMPHEQHRQIHHFLDHYMGRPDDAITVPVPYPTGKRPLS